MGKLRVFLVGLAAAGSLSAGHAAAVTTLGWSISSTGVGHCSGSPCTAPVWDNRTFDYDYSHNASSTASDPARGVAHGSANPGSGFLAAPQLHADTAGAPYSAGAYSWNYSQVQGVQGYTWTGAPTDLALSAFAGTLDFTVGTGGYGQATAAFAILDHRVGEDHALGDFWYKANGKDYGFLGTCSDTGAIAIAETGVINGPGLHTATLSPTCGSPTFHLDTGETFYLWARLFAFTAGNAFTDASHTFSVGIAPDAAPDVVKQLTDNIVRAPPLHVGTSVPEPSVWSLVILGFGAVGHALRRRKTTGPGAALA